MKLITAVVLLSLSSCAFEPKQFEIPKDLIPKDSMILIMHDMSLVESYIHQKYVQLERYALLLRMSGDSLLQDYGMNRERYERSMEYYGKNPKEYMEIFDSVIAKLEAGKVQSTIDDIEFR